MKVAKTLFLGMLTAAVLVTGLEAQAQSVRQASTQGLITRTDIYSKGTSAYESVRQFLLQNTSRNQRQSIDDGDALPESFTVSYTKHIRTSEDLARAQDVPGSPVPLPATGSPGDTISVSSCSAGRQQSWSYLWGNNGSGWGWMLQSYSVRVVNSCKSEPVSQ